MDRPDGDRQRSDRTGAAPRRIRIVVSLPIVPARETRISMTAPGLYTRSSARRRWVRDASRTSLREQFARRQLWRTCTPRDALTTTSVNRVLRGVKRPAMRMSGNGRISCGGVAPGAGRGVPGDTGSSGAGIGKGAGVAPTSVNEPVDGPPELGGSPPDAGCSSSREPLAPVGAPGVEPPPDDAGGVDPGLPGDDAGGRFGVVGVAAGGRFGVVGVAAGGRFGVGVGVAAGGVGDVGVVGVGVGVGAGGVGGAGAGLGGLLAWPGGTGFPGFSGGGAVAALIAARATVAV